MSKGAQSFKTLQAKLKAETATDNTPVIKKEPAEEDGFVFQDGFVLSVLRRSLNGLKIC